MVTFVHVCVVAIVMSTLSSRFARLYVVFELSGVGVRRVEHRLEPDLSSVSGRVGLVAPVSAAGRAPYLIVAFLRIERPRGAGISSRSGKNLHRAQ